MVPSNHTFTLNALKCTTRWVHIYFFLSQRGGGKGGKGGNRELSSFGPRKGFSLHLLSFYYNQKRRKAQVGKGGGKGKRIEKFIPIPSKSRCSISFARSGEKRGVRRRRF